MSQPLIANIHSLKEVKMKEKNQQDRLLGVDRELSDDPEGRVKFEGASQEYEFSSEESEGEENNREVEHALRILEVRRDGSKVKVRVGSMSPHVRSQ